MNYTYRNIWLINFPVMMSILIEQLINITDAIFLGHVGEIELGASALAGIWYLAIYWRFRSKGPQKTDDYFGVKPPKKDFIINKKGRELGSRASNFRSIATQFS